MTKLRIAQFIGFVALMCGCVWKNKFSYPLKSDRWIAVKSLADYWLIILAALYAPALLVSWSVLFMTRHIQSMGIRVTAAVLSGIAFGSIGGIALEVLCAFSVLSVDLVTGAQGVYGRWKQGPPPTFLVFGHSSRFQDGT